MQELRLVAPHLENYSDLNAMHQIPTKGSLTGKMVLPAVVAEAELQ